MKIKRSLIAVKFSDLIGIGPQLGSGRAGTAVTDSCTTNPFGLSKASRAFLERVVEAWRDTPESPRPSTTRRDGALRRFAQGERFLVDQLTFDANQVFGWNAVMGS